MLHSKLVLFQFYSRKNLSLFFTGPVSYIEGGVQAEGKHTHTASYLSPFLIIHMV